MEYTEISIDEKLREAAEKTETALEQYFKDGWGGDTVLAEAMQYSLLGGGKRIRAFLVMEFCRLFGGTEEVAMPYACALEMVHAYSLIHDDLPCMDDDDYRRGKLSNHKVYGEAMATLAGDALLNRAFEIMLSQEQIPAQNAVKAMAYLARCSGVYGMIGGQVQDLALEGKQATDAQLREMVGLKTGALIRAACVCGCLLAGDTAQQITAAEAYANAIGLAFQIQDDILDVTGDQAELGKAIGSDEANEKSTFVSLYGLETCRGMVRNLTMEALEAAEQFAEPEYLRELALYLAERRK